MAPVTFPFDIPDLQFSSLELDSRATKSFDPTTRDLAGESEPNVSKRDVSGSAGTTHEIYNVLAVREAAPTSTRDPHPGAGSIDPNAFNMKGIQALFALIGAAFVIAAIWFFFWAKNGGFKWRQGDWEEYKSTVLRRKGPNGTTLSNATKSTVLGGGSVVGDGYSDKDAATYFPGVTSETDASSEAPIIKAKQLKKNKPKKETAKERKIREANEARWEGGHDDDVRAYRHEKPAQVGGINKSSDAQFYGTDYSESGRGDSEISGNGRRGYGHDQPRRTSPDKRQTRRDFSYGREESFNASTPASAPKPTRYHSPNKNPEPQRPIRTVPGSFNGAADFDVQSQNTRAYHHPIPGLSRQGKAAGYRRDRRDSLDR